MSETTPTVDLPANQSERDALSNQAAQAINAAKQSVYSMGKDYQLMSTFRTLAGIPPNDELWTDAHEHGTQTLFTAYALSNQYISEEHAGMRQIGVVHDSGDIAVAGTPTAEVAVVGSEGRIELVQAQAVSGDAAKAGEAAAANVLAEVDRNGIVALPPLVILAAGTIVTVSAVWVITELCDVTKQKIRQVQLKDQEDLPIRLIQSGYSPEQAQKITADTLAKAQQIVASQATEKSGTGKSRRHHEDDHLGGGSPDFDRWSRIRSVSVPAPVDRE